MKREFDLNKDRVYCKTQSNVIEFVVKGLKDSFQDYVPCLPIGIFQGSEMIGGVLIHDIRPCVDCWLTIYTINPRWAKRHVLKYIFGVVFDLIKAKRCSVLVSSSNDKSLKMCKQLGFINEGILRQFRDNGEDCYVMGMLKNECKWR